MSRLSDLYKAMETLRKEGLPVTDDLEIKANELEEDIIKKEILPMLSRTIEPALQPVKRELVLVVDYVPGQPLSVHLSAGYSCRWSCHSERREIFSLHERPYGFARH